ncbi:hypothetical protein MIDIC_510017 [Alphaproteobacteria bacterium]
MRFYKKSKNRSNKIKFVTLIVTLIISIIHYGIWYNLAKHTKALKGKLPGNFFKSTGQNSKILYN